MRMIRSMCGHTRLDRIKTKATRERVGVTPVKDKLREIRLRWLGPIKKRETYAPMRSYERIDLPRRRRHKGRPENN